MAKERTFNGSGAAGSSENLGFAARIRLVAGKGRIEHTACASGGVFVRSEKFVESHGGKPGDISFYSQKNNATTCLLANRVIELMRKIYPKALADDLGFAPPIIIRCSIALL